MSPLRERFNTYGIESILLPEKFITSSHPLDNLHINNVAWTYKDILDIVEYLAEHDYVILGGDVYRFNGKSLESTYDSWYIQDTDFADKNAVLIAKKKSAEFITMYHNRNGSEFAYSLVLEKRSQH